MTSINLTTLGWKQSFQMAISRWIFKILPWLDGKPDLASNDRSWLDRFISRCFRLECLSMILTACRRKSIHHEQTAWLIITFCALPQARLFADLVLVSLCHKYHDRSPPILSSRWLFYFRSLYRTLWPWLMSLEPLRVDWEEVDSRQWRKNPLNEIDLTLVFVTVAVAWDGDDGGLYMWDWMYKQVEQSGTRK